MFAMHAWESESESGGAHGWESPEHTAHWEDSSDNADAANGDVDGVSVGGGESDDEEFTMREETRGQQLASYMISLLISRSITAKKFCTAMYHAGNAGIAEARPYGLHPDSPSGHFMRHVRKKLPLFSAESAAKLYNVDMPSYSREKLGRSKHDLWVRLPHEAVADDVARHPHIMEDLTDMVNNGDLPRAYYENPIVRELSTPESPILPLGVFVDGVPYSQVDSVVGVWVINLVTSQRYLVTTLRIKSRATAGAEGGVRFGWCLISWHGA